MAQKPKKRLCNFLPANLKPLSRASHTIERKNSKKMLESRKMLNADLPKDPMLSQRFSIALTQLGSKLDVVEEADFSMDRLPKS